MNVYKVVEAGEEFCIMANNFNEALTDLSESYLELDESGEIFDDFSREEIINYYTESILNSLECVGEYVAL